jgi:hypothetical protein
MRNLRLQRALLLIAATLTVLLAMPPAPGRAGEAAYQAKVLYRFFCTPSGECDDGAAPKGLIMDGAGNFYGTVTGGIYTANFPSGAGGVFELTPNTARTGWTEIVLYRFCAQKNCRDGALPNAGLVMDGAGNLYGTTYNGGGTAASNGAVFELMPNETRSAWTETALYRFCPKGRCTYGAHPQAAMVMDEAGNLYGTTANSNGGAFKLTPNETRTERTITALFRFCPAGYPCPRGANPSGLTMDGAGKLYGDASTDSNGTSGPCLFFGCGLVFELTPYQQGIEWAETILHRFCDTGPCTQGADPRGGLIIDDKGNLYGTTAEGGRGGGVVFELEKLP